MWQTVSLESTAIIRGESTMARKKGVVKELSNYGEKHPVVTLALAGTLGYYLYDTMIKPRMETAPKGPNMYQNPAGLGATTSTSTTSSSSHRMPGPGDGQTSMYIDPTKSGMFGIGATRNPPAHLMFDKAQGLGACHKCGTRKNPHCHCGTGASHGIKGLGACHKCGVRKNPHCHCGTGASHGIKGFSPSARRRVGHAGIGMATESYEATLDTQFSNREAMMAGDLKKHQDILGFSGLAPLAGGDWYE